MQVLGRRCSDMVVVAPHSVSGGLWPVAPHSVSGGLWPVAPHNVSSYFINKGLC